MTARDMTKAQFDSACERYGFRSDGFMGYYQIWESPATFVSIWNAGNRRRDQLAYLLRQRDRIEKEQQQ